MNGIIDESLIEINRDNIRFTEILIVDSICFLTHQNCLLLCFIVTTGFLLNLSAILKDFRLTFDFIFNGSFNIADRVKVLALCLSSKNRRTLLTERNVDIATPRSVFPLTIGNTEISDDFADGFHVFPCLLSRMPVRLRDDFNQRSSATIEVQ